MNKPKIQKVSKKVFTKYATRYGVEIGESFDGLVNAINAVAERMSSAASIARCDVCEGDSDSTLPECPFCGDSDNEEAGEKEAEETMSEPKKGRPRTAKVSKPAKEKPSKEKPSKPAKEKPAKEKPAKEKPAKTAIVKAETTTLAVKVVSSTELKAAVKRVGDMQRRGIETVYELGLALFEIYEKKLYTQMTVDGKPVYTDWTSFCKKELGVSPNHGFRLMDVAANYSKEDVLELGVTKLNLLLRVPESDRERLKVSAKNLPASKLGEEVKKLAGGQKRDTGRDGFKGKPGKGRPAKEKIEKSDKVTVVRASANSIVELFNRGTTNRAHTLEDAVGEERCANGVIVRYSLLKTDEGLSVAVEVIRESDT